MRTFVIGIPGLIGDSEDESVLRNRHPLIAEIASRSRVFKLDPSWNLGSWLGLELSESQMAAGPLLLASLKIKPPERSVGFCLSLGSIDENGLVQLPGEISANEDQEVREQLVKLNTRMLTLVAGFPDLHGLVWENGSLDCGVTAFGQAVGRPLSENLPEGDGEALLRTLIDDSMNLLDGLEINKRRADDGQPRLNLLWPWGFGFMPELPHLALRRGMLFEYFSPHWRLAGLVRLAGYHVNENPILKGIHISESAWERFFQSLGAVIVSPKSQMMRHLGRIDELDFELELLERRLEKQFQNRVENPFRLLLVCPRIGGEGLGLAYDSSQSTSNTLPFDERVLDDSKFPRIRLSEILDQFLSAQGLY